MSHTPTAADWKRLLTLFLSQRLEMNALEGALSKAGVLTDAYIREIRTQALDTAKAWSSEDRDDVLALIGVHASPGATMRITPPASQ